MEKRNIIQEICDELLNADNLFLSDEEIKLCEDYKSQNNNLGLSDSAIKRIIRIKRMIESSYYGTSISVDEVITFLKSAMTYNGFSDLNFDEETPMKSKIEYYLLETPDDETLRIYDAEINTDKRNIDNIDKMINESDVGSADIIFIRENGNGIEPTITEESRKKLAKILIK